MVDDRKLSKTERLKLLYEYLSQCEPATDYDSALALISATLMEIEDQYSGVPYDPAEAGVDGRMYAPAERYRRAQWERLGVRCYWQVAHATFLADNGAIEVRPRVGANLGAISFEKAGKDGRKVSDYESP